MDPLSAYIKDIGPFIPIQFSCSVEQNLHSIKNSREGGRGSFLFKNILDNSPSMKVQHLNISVKPYVRLLQKVPLGRNLSRLSYQEIHKWPGNHS